MGNVASPLAHARTAGGANEASDIANAVLFLVSEEARNISGQLLVVAGGLNPGL